MENPVNLIDLPFEVLDLIYSWLTNIGDKLNLAEVNHILGDGFLYHNYKRFTEINFDDYSLWEILSILKYCGPTIRFIRASTKINTNLTLNDVAKCCPNLEFLELRIKGPFDEKVAIEVLPKLISLKGIEITSTESTFYNKVMDSLHKLPNLCKISLKTHASPDAMSRIIRLRQLEELRLHVVDLIAEYTEEYTKLLSKLRRLYYNCDGTLFSVKRALERLSECNSELEELVLTNITIGFELELPYLSKLKHLTLHFYTQKYAIPTLIHIRSINLYAKHLEELSLDVCYPEHATFIGRMQLLKELKCVQLIETDCLDEILKLKLLERLCYRSKIICQIKLLNVLRNCKKLRYLDIQGCMGLTNYFVYNSLHILYENGVKPYEPFILLADYTGIDRNIRHQLYSEPYESLLQVRFGLEPFFKKHIFAT